MRLRVVLAIIGLCCCAAVVGFFVFRAHSPGPRPNLLLITLDTLRRDHLSCYGYEKETTPAVDELAKESVKYEDALTPASWTLPAHASLFTGMLPTFHGAHYGPIFGEGKKEDLLILSLNDGPATLAGELKKAGYKTGAVIGGPVLHSSSGLGRGFDFYFDGIIRESTSSAFYRPAHETTTLAVRWLKENYSLPQQAPFFLFLNYFDAHSPYNAPEPWGKPDVPKEKCKISSGYYDDVFKGIRDLTDDEYQFLTNQYDDEIRYMDWNIRRLFYEMKQLGLYDSTMIIVTSDHGETFGEHRRMGHGRALYDELLRVPLIIKYPLKDAKVGVVKDRVSIASIMATVLEYLGLPVPKSVSYKSLSHANQPMAAEIFRDITWIVDYGKRYDRDMKALYDGDYKWIWNSNGEQELYNIKEDPGEMDNKWGTSPEIEQRMQARLDDLLAGATGPQSSAAMKIDDELKTRLEALGYVR